MVIKISHNLASQTLSIYICLFFITLYTKASEVTTDKFIEEIPLNFDVLPGTEETISIKDNPQVVVCKVNINGKNRPGKGKFDFVQLFKLANANLCTHVIYGPVFISRNHEIEDNSTFGSLHQMTSLPRERNLKILLGVSVSRDNAGFMKPLIEYGVSADQTRLKFINYMLSFLKKYNFNGLSLDAAFYSAIQGRTSNTFPSYLSHAQIPSAEVLAKVMKDAFQIEGLLIATEIDSNRKRTIHKIIKGLKSQLLSLRYGRMAECSKIFDLVIIIGFTVDFRAVSNHNAPIHSDLIDDDTIYEHLKAIIVDWKSNPNTVIFSIEFFGHPFLLYDNNSSLPGLKSPADPKGFPYAGPYLNSTSLWGYNEICAVANQSWKLFWDHKAKMPFIRNGYKWITFENHRSTYEKVALATSFGVKGIMAQNVDVDDFAGRCSGVSYPLLKTIIYAMEKEKTNHGSLRCLLLKNETENQSFAPIVVTNFHMLNVSNNSDVKIECTAEAFPEPEITIIHHYSESNVIKLTNVKESVNRNNCSFQKTLKTTFLVKASDAGKYSCVAKNSAGTSNRDFFIMLKELPYLLAENDVWLRQTHLDFKIPDLSYIGMADKNQVIVCKLDLNKKKQKIFPSPLQRYKLATFDLSEPNNTFDSKLCSHLIYGPVYVTKAYEIVEEDKIGDLYKVKNISRRFPSLKILLEITIGPYIDIIDSRIMPENLQRLKDIMRRFGFHGIHFNSKFYSNAARATYYNTKDISYVAMGSQMKREFEEEKFITSTEIEINSRKLMKNHSELFSNIIQRFDLVLLKAYDFNKDSSPKVTEYNAPLDSFVIDEENIKNNLQYLLKENKANISSLVLGVPLFGDHYILKEKYSLTFGLNSTTAILGKERYSFGTICSWVLSEKSKWKMFWDKKAQVPFLKKDIYWITFDNPKSIARKVEFYINLQTKFKLGGIMVDSIESDDFSGRCSNLTYPLLRTVYTALKERHKIDTKDGEITVLSVVTWGWIVAIIIMVLIMFLCGNYICYIKFIKQNDKTKEMEQLVKFLQGNKDRGNIYIGPTDNELEDPIKISYDQKYELDKSLFSIGKLIGSGEYGEVFRGHIKGVVDGEVAFKTVKLNSPFLHLKALVIELKILMYIGHHENVVRLIGAYTKDIRYGTLYVVTELCAQGSLDVYLKSNKHLFLKTIEIETNNIGDNIQPQDYYPFPIHSVYSLLKWSIQIARAMEYLGKKMVIHFDLATRNVLLSADFVAKVTDFGLSRKNYTYIKKGNEALPWQTLAIECLKSNIYSARSDVWAYGITLWEIFSLGSVPYPGISYSPQFVDALEKGLQNDKPKHAPPEMYLIMMQCWKLDPKERPTFDVLIKQLEEILLSLQKKRTELRERTHVASKAYVKASIGYYNSIQTKCDEFVMSEISSTEHNGIQYVSSDFAENAHNCTDTNADIIKKSDVVVYPEPDRFVGSGIQYIGISDDTFFDKEL